MHKKVHLFSVYIVCGGDYVNWENPCLLFFMHKSKYTFCAVFVLEGGWEIKAVSFIYREVVPNMSSHSTKVHILHVHVYRIT